MATIISLSELPVGKIGTITNISSTAPMSRRLMDLGFIPGTTVLTVSKAPMGDPITFEIKGYQLGLRKTESSIINVEANLDE